MYKKNDNILARGEVTGHYHEAVGEGVEVFSDNPEDGFASFMKAPLGVSIVHQEHKPVEIGEEKAGLFGGEFKVAIVQEYDYDMVVARRILD